MMLVVVIFDTIFEQLRVVPYSKSSMNGRSLEAMTAPWSYYDRTVTVL